LLVQLMCSCRALTGVDRIYVPAEIEFGNRTATANGRASQSTLSSNTELTALAQEFGR
jgi:hypothetical protein